MSNVSVIIITTYNVTMEWENGEITPEPLSIIAKDAPVACAIYARDNNLLDTPGWKRFKRIAKKQKKLRSLYTPYSPIFHTFAPYDKTFNRRD